MGRIRSIKPEFGANESLSTLPAETHLLAALLHPYADDEGYFQSNPKLVQSLCIPLREDSLSVHEQLKQLEQIGYIERKTCAGGKVLGRLVSFKEDQRVNRPTPSKLKALWDGGEPSVTAHEQLNKDSPQEGKGREGKGRERKGGEEAPPDLDREEPTPEEIADAENNHGHGDPTPPKARHAIAANVDPSHLDAVQCAKAMFKHLGITAPAQTVNLAADAIRILSKQLAGTPHGAMLVIRRRAELAVAAGETVNRFWFEDGGWKGEAYRGPSRPDPFVGKRVPTRDEILESRRKAEEQAEAAPEGADTAMGERIWEGMSAALRHEINAQSYDTWIKPIKPRGVMNGKLYLQIPSPDFSHVQDRYEIAKFLPAGVDGIHLLSATGAAA